MLYRGFLIHSNYNSEGIIIRSIIHKYFVAIVYLSEFLITEFI